MSRLITLQETAEILSISEVGVRRLLKTGKLKGFKVGGLWRISKEEINRFLNMNSNVPIK